MIRFARFDLYFAVGDPPYESDLVCAAKNGSVEEFWPTVSPNAGLRQSNFRPNLKKLSAGKVDPGPLRAREDGPKQVDLRQHCRLRVFMLSKFGQKLRIRMDL